MSDYITGMEGLIGKLQSLKKTEAKKAINKGARAGAKIVQAQAKRLAPHRTGALERGIKVRALKRSRVWTGVTATLSMFYGAFQELGTKKMEAKHFMQKAAEQSRGEAIGTALDIIKEEIMKL